MRKGIVVTFVCCALGYVALEQIWCRAEAGVEDWRPCPTETETTGSSVFAVSTTTPAPWLIQS